MAELLISLLIWLAAGAVAFAIMGGSKKWYVDLGFGFLGAVLGGWLFSLLGVSVGWGLIGAFIVALVGAVIAIWIARQLGARV